MSKIINDCLTRSGTGRIYSCTDMATVSVKGLTVRLGRILLHVMISPLLGPYL